MSVTQDPAVGRVPDRAELLALAGPDPLDLSLGFANDPAALAGTADVGRYPLCRGAADLRAAIARMFDRDLGVEVDPAHVAPCAGVKEFLATTPLLLARERPGDTVLLPELAYAPYRHGIALAGLRAHPVPRHPDGRMDLGAVPIDVARRALMLWATSPGNPTGVVEDGPAIVTWGRDHGVPVFVDEAYVDLVWSGSPETVLRHGTDGVVAVQSLSKSYGHPGVRLGWFAGDPDLVAALVAARRDTGLIASTPAQAHTAAVLADPAARAERRGVVGERLHGLVAALEAAGIPCATPPGGMFAWVRSPRGTGADLARRLAAGAGIVAAPGAGFGPAGRDHVRLAAVAPVRAVADRLERVWEAHA